MVDDVRLVIKAGNGGDGKSSFLREKFMPKGGPDGGDGGNGGSVYLVGDRDLNTLRSFSGKKRFEAESGEPGGKRKSHGSNGADLYVKVPLGTVVHVHGHVYDDIVEHKQELMIAKGGKGGRGNTHFKNSTHQSPIYAEPGEKTEELDVELELKVLADVGLVGLPNAGKSTLLSVLTKARPEIGDYPFTTIEPNIGVMEISKDRQRDALVLADIPGLIEGASEGKGLGHTFLRHIERCRMLVYVLFVPQDVLFDESLSVGEKAQALVDQYELLKKELLVFQPTMAKKMSMIAVNKMDLYEEALRKEIDRVFVSRGEQMQLFSAATGEGVQELKEKLVFTLFR